MPELRIWSAGCSSGEEPYSLAILALEAAAKLRPRPSVRIVASDLDEVILARAQAGRYPEASLVALSAAQRRDYFVADGASWSVAPSLRECIVFRKHNLFADPPPPELDLILCRNVMIYFSRDLQQKLLRGFPCRAQARGLFHDRQDGDRPGSRAQLMEACVCPRAPVSESLAVSELQEHLNVGLAFSMSKRWDEAAREFEAATKAGPNDPEAFFQLGKAYQAQGLSAKAEVALRRCCELDASRIEARARLGQVLGALGRRDEAEASLREALAKDSGSVLALNSLGDVLMAKGRLEDAAAAWERTLAAQPDQPDAHYKLVFAYESLGQLDTALGHYKLAVQMQPQRLPLRLALAGLFEKLGQQLEAAKAWGEAVALRPQEGGLLLNWASALERAGDKASAADVLAASAAGGPRQSAGRAAFGLGQSRDE